MGLHEYAPVHHFEALFVLCQVSLTEEIAFLRMLSSCAEECISAVHNNGTQHDGFLTPDIAEAEVHNDCSVDMKNDLSRYSLRLGREFDG